MGLVMDKSRPFSKEESAEVFYVLCSHCHEPCALLVMRDVAVSNPVELVAVESNVMQLSFRFNFHCTPLAGFFRSEGNAATGGGDAGVGPFPLLRTTDCF